MVCVGGGGAGVGGSVGVGVVDVVCLYCMSVKCVWKHPFVVGCVSE